MTRRVLEYADRPLEQVHHRDLLAALAVRVTKRGAFLEGRGHQRDPKVAGLGPGQLPHPDLDLPQRRKRALILVEQELAAYPDRDVVVEINVQARLRSNQCEPSGESK